MKWKSQSKPKNTYYMAINPYFNNFGQVNEQRLVDDLLIEQIKINGIDVLYVPKTFVALDRLYGEDPQRAFLKAFPIEMYPNNFDGFQGSSFVSQFGYQMEKQMDFIVSKARFEQILNTQGAWEENPENMNINPVRPNEGDLIYFNLTGELFEISEANHEMIFYQLGKVYVWKISCTKYDFSHEIFDTGVPELDQIADDFENNDSVVKDPTADNTEITTNLEAFLDTTQPSPFSE
jgi:Virus neck protein